MPDATSKNAAANYHWLDGLGTLPRMIAEARKLVGIKEAPGAVDNPVIIGWAKEVRLSLDDTYAADSVPWCGLFMTVVASRAGKTPPKLPLWALNWGKFGDAGGQPDLGDVMTFTRTTATGQLAGHVGLYVGEDVSHYHLLGGNQDDSVCYARHTKDRLRAIRQPPYMQKPASARPFALNMDGTPAKVRSPHAITPVAMMAP